MAVGLVTLTVGSLFSGIGGLDLGLERAGMEIQWQSEIDPYCCRVLAKHWPDVRNLGDVRCARFEEAPPVDVLAGGFPCQDLSSAGRRAGIKGKHSRLWAHFARAVEALRPRYVIVENSPALILRGLDVILADLARLGFDAEWHCVPAAAVGAPHVRARLWLLAYPRGLGDRLPAAALPAGRPGAVDGGWWASEPGVVRVADGAAPLLDGVVIENAHESCFQESRAARLPDHDRLRVMWDNGTAPAASSRPQRCVVCDDPLSVLPHGSGSGAWKMGSREPTSEGLRHLREKLHRVQPFEREELLTRVPVRGGSQKLTEAMGSRVNRLRALGNSVVPQVAELIGRRVMEMAA
jgi:DNA (cytosine-5)-methyltransferase 1